MANVDFTTGTELDTGAVLTVTSTTITATAISGASPATHVSFDRTAGYFSGDFTMRFGPINLTSPSSNNSRISLLKVSMGADTADDIEDRSLIVRWVNTVTNPTLSLAYFAADTTSPTAPTTEQSYTGAGVNASTNFYFELQRSGTTATLKAYSDTYTTQVGSTMSITVTVSAYRYVHAAAKYMSGTGATLSGTLQNLDMDYSAGGGSNSNLFGGKFAGKFGGKL